MTYGGATGFLAGETARARAVTRMCDALVAATGAEGVGLLRLASAVEAWWTDEAWALLGLAAGVGWRTSETTRGLVVDRLRVRGRAN